MTGTHSRRAIVRIARAVMASGLLLGVTMVAAERGQAVRDQAADYRPERDRGGNDAEDTLLVWASDKAHAAADFLAVIDFDRRSPHYGKVVDTVPLVGPGAIGNEPHHVGLSRDGRTMALGGLLSVLKGQDQVFFFDVTNPRNPTFI